MATSRSYRASPEHEGQETGHLRARDHDHDGASLPAEMMQACGCNHLAGAGAFAFGSLSYAET